LLARVLLRFASFARESCLAVDQAAQCCGMETFEPISSDCQV
jgi:hypothetical protein